MNPEDILRKYHSENSKKSWKARVKNYGTKAAAVLKANVSRGGKARWKRNAKKQAL